MKTKNWILAVAVILSLAVSLASCGGGGGGGGGVYACSSERRSTGCNNYVFGAWAADCYQFNAADYYITPEEVCANVTSGGLWCESSCCITTEYQNVNLSAGTCY